MSRRETTSNYCFVLIQSIEVRNILDDIFILGRLDTMEICSQSPAASTIE